MKFLSLFFVFITLLSACSLHRKEEHVPIERPKDLHSKKVRVKSEKGSKKAQETKGAVWELLAQTHLTLQFLNIDNGSTFQVVLEEGIQERRVPEGHWELTGFEENGTSFVSMNTSRKFIFTMKKNRRVYAGSIIIGCPKLSPEQLTLLRPMKFFNRYPFSSSEGLCELTIGNNGPNVKDEMKAKKLFMGF